MPLRQLREVSLRVCYPTDTAECGLKKYIKYDIVQTEVRATYNTKAYRILFACEGRFHHVLLSLEGFQKKTQQTPKANIKLAEQRLATARESKASGSGEGKENMNGTGFSGRDD